MSYIEGAVSSVQSWVAGVLGISSAASYIKPPRQLPVSACFNWFISWSINSEATAAPQNSVMPRSMVSWWAHQLLNQQDSFCLSSDQDPRNCSFWEWGKMSLGTRPLLQLCCLSVILEPSLCSAWLLAWMCWLAQSHGTDYVLCSLAWCGCGIMKQVALLYV